jgi:transmembrane sensor
MYTVEYMNSEIINLLHQYEFKQWVLEPTEDTKLYWEKYLEDNPDQCENVKKARETILRIRFKSRDLSEIEIDDLLQRIINTNGSHIIPHHVEKKNWQWLKIAAVISLVFSLALLFSQTKNQSGTKLEPEHATFVIKENKKGVKSRFSLPDGSKVTLNSESTLRFQDEHSEVLRIVELNGEAFFEVQESPVPFEVRAGNHRIRVLGTKFNVNVYPGADLVNVALVEGKVMVQKDGQSNQQYMLNPGEKFQYTKHSDIAQVMPFKELLETGWKDGILVFENDNFETFISKLEKWYGVEFIVHGSPTKRWNVNGAFRNENLSDILEGVCYTHHIDYTIKEKTVIIRLN